MAVAHQIESRTKAESRPASTPMLDALPCAAAIIDRVDGIEVISARNEAFAAIVRAGRDAIDIATWHDRIAGVITQQKIDRADWRDGAIVEGRHYSVTIAPISRTSALISLIDRTNEVQTEKSLRSEMLHDSLTGLPNRLGFVEQIERQFEDESCADYAVVLVDLARFSRVNECIGSLGGDELIMTVARRLMSALRGHDQVARTGANEFALVVKIVDGPGDVLHVAKRIETVMAQPFRLSDFEMKVDCAIGCALASDSDGDGERLMRHAQIALKTAKTSARVEFYQPSALAAARRHFIIETELRRALDRNSLTMAYQPLMSLKTGKVVGFEALARWRHPVMGIVSPEEFIAVAEESGLIVPLGRWALDNALKTLRVWDLASGRKLPLSMAVNLSAIQIARDDVAKFVEAGLRDHGIQGSRLTIELTESAIIADPDRAARTLAALKACDTMVAMDDFGTGFSNLAALQRLPIDMLKIDRSFITNMIGDADKVAIVRAILSLAEALGMATTAEGIETPTLADTLSGLGCTTGQGYLYAKPMTSDEAFSFALASLEPIAD
jgi:diguanylate cyclase (GGDEF)-like protein